MTAALALDPRSVDARVASGALLHLTGDLPRARAEADEALRLGPRDLEALRLAAAVRLAEGDFRGGGALLDEALALRPDDAELLSNRASVRGALHDDEGSITDLERVQRVRGGLSWQEAMTLAKALFRLKRWSAAEAAYARTQAVAPTDDPTLVEELASEGRQAGARARGEEAIEAIGRGETQRAIALLTKAAELDPSFTNARFNRGIMLREAGDLQAALADFDVAVERGLLEGLLERATVRRALNDLAGARADLTLGVEQTEASAELGQAFRARLAELGP